MWLQLVSDTTCTRQVGIQKSRGKMSNVRDNPFDVHYRQHLICADDVTSAKSKLKGEEVSADSAKKQGEEWAAKAGSQLDNAVGLPPHRALQSKSSAIDVQYTG